MARMPQVTERERVRFPKSRGIVEQPRSGSHSTLRHPERNVTITVPVHTGVDAGRGLAARLLHDAGYSVEDYLALR
jgi:predicted RNA binding protein YcfA (HicA-like mRNA interferase family)